MSCKKDQTLKIVYTAVEQKITADFKDANNYANLFIYSNDWVIYPPGNEMPPNAIYFNLPDNVKVFKNLKHIMITNVFITKIPLSLADLKQLETLSFRIGPKSDLTYIIQVLEKLAQLKKLDLTGSIISKEMWRKLHDALPNVEITTQLI